MANQTNDKIRRVDLIEQSWGGIVTKLQTVFSKNSGINSQNIEVLATIDPDDFEYLQEQKGDTKLKLPIIVVSPTQIDPDPESFNRNELRQRGYTLKMCSDRANWLMLKASPTILTCRVDLVSDDVLTMMRMLNTWSANEIWGFQLAFSDWKAKIQVHANKSLAIPPRVVTSGGERQFRLSTTLTAKTYAGYIYKILAIRKVEVEFKIANAATIEEAMSDPTIVNQIFAVKTFTTLPGTDEVQFIPTV